MGERASKYWRHARPRGLSYALIGIMSDACYSCIDNDAMLYCNGIGWFMEKATVGQRTLERHITRLAGLNLLVRGEQGFRLPLFYEWDRQNGGAARQNVRQNDRQNGGSPTPPNTEGNSLDYLEIKGGEPTPRSFKHKPGKSENREKHAALWTALVDFMTSDLPMPAWCEQGTPEYELMRQGFDQVGGKYRFRGWEKRPQDASFARDEFLEYLAIHDQGVKA